jgi:hypothetical protein
LRDTRAPEAALPVKTSVEARPKRRPSRRAASALARGRWSEFPSESGPQLNGLVELSQLLDVERLGPRTDDRSSEHPTGAGSAPAGFLCTGMRGRSEAANEAGADRRC